MITQAYIDTIIIKAQRAAADYSYLYSQEKKYGESGKDNYNKMVICYDGYQTLNDNNELTDAQKQIVVDRLLMEGRISTYSSSAFPITVTIDT